MRGKEVDTANVDNLSRPVASRVDEVRMVVADRVSWSLGLGAFVKVQTEKPTLACSSLSLLTMVLGSMRLIPLFVDGN